MKKFVLLMDSSAEEKDREKRRLVCNETLMTERVYVEGFCFLLVFLFFDFLQAFWR